MANGINALWARKTAISQAAPQRFTALRHADTAIVELFSEAMQRLTELAYERDDDGAWSNIDPVTWRLLLPAPFGRAGHKRWGISRSESDVLRDMLRERQVQTDSRPPGLWLYDSSRKCWRLNVYDFDALADGQAYWQRWQLTVQEYRLARSRRLGR